MRGARGLQVGRWQTVGDNVSASRKEVCLTGSIEMVDSESSAQGGRSDVDSGA